MLFFAAALTFLIKIKYLHFYIVIGVLCSIDSPLSNADGMLMNHSFLFLYDGIKF